LRTIKAVLFDLDDTLLNRNMAVDQLFLRVIEKCYEDISDSEITDMLIKFRNYDKSAYGNSDKTKVLKPFFNEFPPTYRLSGPEIQNFWNQHFPHCFSLDTKTIDIINSIKKLVQVAIITNGSTHRQKAKIVNTKLNGCFDIVIISEEAGFSKPDTRIFELTLTKLEVQPEEALFVGDDLEKDIGGCQNAHIKGVWFNPHKIKNDSDIKPYAEINSMDELFRYIT
jgi:putative hydrolase of the HAD superfamily